MFAIDLQRAGLFATRGSQYRQARGHLGQHCRASVLAPRQQMKVTAKQIEKLLSNTQIQQFVCRLFFKARLATMPQILRAQGALHSHSGRIVGQP